MPPKLRRRERIIPELDLVSFFGAADAADLDTFMTFMTDDVRFQFGNDTPVQGKNAVAGAVAAFLAGITSQKHRIDREYRSEQGRVIKLSVTYERLDGSVVTLPATDVLRIVDGLVTDYRIYMEATP